MNTVNIIGRFTKDPEVKKLNNGNSVCDFTLAVDRPYKDKDGQKRADFVRCQAWRQQAGMIAHYFKKGYEVAITGNLQSSSYTNADGRNVTDLYVLCQEITFTSGTPKDGHNKNATTQDKPIAPTEMPTEAFEPMDDEDIPFDF